MLDFWEDFSPASMFPQAEVLQGFEKTNGANKERHITTPTPIHWGIRLILYIPIKLRLPVSENREGYGMFFK
jgi:hypothetical protein